MPVRVTLYTKPGCHLCDEAKAHLLDIGQHVPLTIDEVDISADPSLLATYGERIPVIRVGDSLLEAPIDASTLATAVIRAGAGAEPGRERPRREPSERQRRTALALDRGVLWLARHWAAVVSVVMSLYAGIPFLAPVAMNAGLTGLGITIYRVYGPMCHQFAFRSWFLFGEQTVYPRERTNPGTGTFETFASQEPYFDGIDLATLDADLIYAAKRFPGSERMGWKVAFCQRDVSIYGSIALFGLAFIVLRALKVRIPYLPFWAYLLLAIAPMGLDGVSQYLANPPFNGLGLSFYPLRESTPFLRVLTGSLFGIGNAWLAFPYIEDSMRETIEAVQHKLARAGVKGAPAEDAARAG